MAEYIERETFMHFLVKQHCENCDKRKGMKNGKECFVYDIGDAPCRSCGVDDALDYIEYFPSADVQPVKHGKWIERNPQNSKICRLIECSECGEGYIVNINIPYDEWISTLTRKYCGCCGAYMRGKE